MDTSEYVEVDVTVPFSEPIAGEDGGSTPAKFGKFTNR